MAMTGLPTLTITEAKMVWRDPAGLIVPLGLPTLILVMNGMGSDGAAVPGFGGMTVLDAYITPLTLVMVLSMVGILNLPSFLATYRKIGVLRRLAVTPASPAMVLLAQVLVSLVQAVIGMTVAFAIARAAFDIAGPASLGWALVTLAVAACAIYAIGVLIAAVAPTTNAAIAIGLVGFFAMMALGGGFGPRENLPGWLATVGEYLPFGAAQQALSDSWTGSAPDLAHLSALAVVAVVAGAAAAKLFRWE